MGIDYFKINATIPCIKESISCPQSVCPDIVVNASGENYFVQDSIAVEMASDRGRFGYNETPKNC